MSKTKKISFIFFISIMLGNIGIWTAPLLSASEIEKDFETNEIEYMLEEELELTKEEIAMLYSMEEDLNQGGKATRSGIGFAAAVAYAIKAVGTLLVKKALKVIALYGYSKACKSYTGTNKALKLICMKA